jgi:hypothetical protein
VLSRRRLYILRKTQDYRRPRTSQKCALNFPEALPPAIQPRRHPRDGLHERAFILEMPPRQRRGRDTRVRVVDITLPHRQHRVHNVMSLARQVPIETVEKP